MLCDCDALRAVTANAHKNQNKWQNFDSIVQCICVSVCAVNTGRHRQATHTHTHAVPYFRANEINIFSISCAFDSLMQMHFVCSAGGGRTKFCRSPEPPKQKTEKETKNEGKTNARLVHLCCLA